MTESEESWQERVAAVAQIVRRGLPQFIGFELFLRVIALAIFTPLTAWLSARLIAWSGDGAISNYDIAGFLISINGLLYLTAVVSIAFALLFFEFGGLVALAIGLQRSEGIRLPQLFRLLGLALPRLWGLAVRQFLTYLARAVPSLVVTGIAYQVFLTKNDINYYLIAKPPQFWIALALASAAAVTWAFFAIRLFIDWIHSVPLLLFGGLSPAAAMKESKALVAGKRRRVAMMLLRWLAATLLMFLTFWLLMAGLKFALLEIAGQRVGLTLGVIAILAVVHFLGAGVVGIIAMAALACAEARLFLRIRPETDLPGALTGGQPALLHRIAAFLRVGWVVVLILAALSAFAAVRIVDRIRFDDDVGISAHRGSSITAPENTMAAILLAVEEGADFVEIDVQETKDGTVVLVHDKDLKRVFNIDKGIWEVTYDELKDLDSGGWFSPAFSDQRLATLDQVIKAVKGRAKLNIELKFNGHQQKLAREVVRIVHANGFADQCILTSLDYAGIRRARSAGPDIRTGLIVTSAIGDITKLETNLLSVSASSVNRDLIRRAHLRNLEVHVWTVNDVSTMSAMIGMGVDNIITDNPKLLGELLRTRSELSNPEKAILQLAEIATRRF